MRKLMPIHSSALLLTAIAPDASVGLAQDADQVRLAFEHGIPNITGKSMVATVVTYPPGENSPPHHHAQSAFIYAYVLSGAIRSRVGNEPPRSIRLAKVSMRSPALITGSARMRVIKPGGAFGCLVMGTPE